MYTVHMSLPFRILVLSVATLWALVPQLACFVPEEMLTEAEEECCRQMANECGGTNMSHECCPNPVRIDVGTAAKVIRHAAPQFQIAGILEMATPALLAGARLSIQDGEALPDNPDTSSLILRI
jgi:hypothetical protein